MIALGLLAGVLLAIFILYLIVGLLCAGCYWVWNIFNNERLAKYFYYNDKEDIQKTIAHIHIYFNNDVMDHDKINFYQDLLYEYRKVTQHSKDLTFSWWIILFSYIGKLFKKTFKKMKIKTAPSFGKIMAKVAEKKYKNKWVEEKLNGKENDEEIK